MTVQRDERIEKFLDTLPRGIKLHAGFWKSHEDGLLYPSVAIRYWLELPSKTDDGRDIAGSKSAWTCIAFTNGRQYAAILTEALRKQHPKVHYEVWALFAFNSEPGPHIIDYEPDLYGKEAFRGKPGRHTDITEQDVRDFAREYVIDYYNLHPSNHRFVEILSCERHMGHYANWACRVNFSASGDVVTLLVSPTIQGLEVFEHEYDE